MHDPVPQSMHPINTVQVSSGRTGLYKLLYIDIMCWAIIIFVVPPTLCSKAQAFVVGDVNRLHDIHVIPCPLHPFTMTYREEVPWKKSSLAFFYDLRVSSAVAACAA